MSSVQSVTYVPVRSGGKYVFAESHPALFLLFARFGMARKGTDPGLVLVEAIAALIGFGMLFVFVKDPAAGRALFRVVPWVILTIAAVAGILFIAFSCLSGGSVARGSAIGDGPNVFRRVSSTPSETSDVPAGAFPKVEFDRQRERILSLEEKLDRLDWFQFEKMVAMLYCSRGCQVERRGGAKPDGGIDVVVQSGESRFAVQCKFWKVREVGVRQVRELMGALQDERIAKGVIFSIKGFTDPARELAGRNGIELLGKSEIVQMLNEARFTPHIRELKAIMESKDKYCPRCERVMVLRRSSKDGSQFWGCSGFPRCWYKMDVRED